MKAAVADMLKDFHKPVNRSDWDATPATINAFYARQKNDISSVFVFFYKSEIYSFCAVFPAAYLQCPMFVSSAPHYQNYGRLGYVIGHEITHGYDDQGDTHSVDHERKTGPAESSSIYCRTPVRFER